VSVQCDLASMSFAAAPMVQLKCNKDGSFAMATMMGSRDTACQDDPSYAGGARRDAAALCEGGVASVASCVGTLSGASRANFILK